MMWTKSASSALPLLALLLWRLKLETKRQLNLTLAEEEAVGKVTRRAERRVESSNHVRARSTEHVHAVVHTRHLRAVEDVETFSQEFKLRTFRDAEATRDAHVDVLDRRRVEEVIWRQPKTQRSVRTVNTTSRARTEGVGSRNSRGRGERVRDGSIAEA